MQGREDFQEDPRLSRPPINFINIKILSALEEEPFHYAYSLVKVMDVSDSTLIRHLQDSLGMRSFHLRWVSHELTSDLRRPGLKFAGDDW
jgi:hypothetical protein